MAVVGLKTNTYIDNTGLLQYFGKAQSTSNRWGEENIPGTNKRVTQGSIDLTSLATLASGNQTIVADNVFIPKGALIEEIKVTVTKETTGVNANLNLGLVKEDRSTEYDFDGLLAAADAFNAGTDLGTVTTYNVGTTEAGAKLGTVLTEACLLTAAPETADFTAGVINVRIIWSRPLSADV